MVGREKKGCRRRPKISKYNSPTFAANAKRSPAFLLAAPERAQTGQSVKQTSPCSRGTCLTDTADRVRVQGCLQLLTHERRNYHFERGMMPRSFDAEMAMALSPHLQNPADRMKFFKYFCYYFLFLFCIQIIRLLE
jgi:hypothetical protein